MNRTENLTPEQAIEILTAFANGSADYPTEDFEKALKMGAEAIGRCEIAKKSTDKIVWCDWNIPLCPSCQKKIMSREFEHCERCGQKLDWSDVDG